MIYAAFFNCLPYLATMISLVVSTIDLNEEELSTIAEALTDDECQRLIRILHQDKFILPISVRVEAVDVLFFGLSRSFGRD